MEVGDENTWFTECLRSSDAIFKVQGPVQRDDIRLVILISKRDVIQLEGYNAIRKTLEDYFSTDVASVVGNFSLCGRDVANPGVVMKSERIPLAYHIREEVIGTEKDAEQRIVLHSGSLLRCHFDLNLNCSMTYKFGKCTNISGRFHIGLAVHRHPAMHVVGFVSVRKRT